MELWLIFKQADEGEILVLDEMELVGVLDEPLEVGGTGSLTLIGPYTIKRSILVQKAVESWKAAKKA